MTTRRDFIRLTAFGAAVLVNSDLANCNTFSSFEPTDELSDLSHELLEIWSDKLILLQIADKPGSTDFGGFMCPACGRVHGRVGDAIYPMLYRADKTQKSKYLDSAVQLYRWMERNVSQPDGSWINDPNDFSWKGITVFTAIALAETLKNHRALLDKAFINEIETRLKKAGDFIKTNFSINYGNINYPISASYGLTLLGEVLDIKEFREKGRIFAHEALSFFSSNDRLLTGEGGPYNKASGKNCYSVDLGYNVEESLPAFVLYGKLTNDTEVLDAVTASLKSHMEFMLPDGAWDNSWGTRNFKWTYWGSRTTDGCQPAYALMADRDPRFYKVALKNTELLKACTNDGLLYGGPHYLSHNVLPCVHHTFCHIKSLTTILEHGFPVSIKGDAVLPREKVYGSKFFQDIQTYLISKGKFRATVTGYDREYSMKNGHATGGALTLLWHENTGPLLSASMNEYQLKEANNMQPDKDVHSIALTPRIELLANGRLYMNISDLAATIDVKEDGNKLIVRTSSRLVDKDQASPPTGEIKCDAVYTFQENKIILEFNFHKNISDNSIRVVFPVISKSSEKVEIKSDKSIYIHKDNSVVKVSADCSIMILPTTSGRIFNFVPGLEAIPLAVSRSQSRIEIEVA